MRTTPANMSPSVEAAERMPRLPLRHGHPDDCRHVLDGRVRGQQPADAATGGAQSLGDVDRVAGRCVGTAVGPGGTLIKVDDTGHNIHDDQPDLVMDAIRDVMAG